MTDIQADINELVEEFDLLGDWEERYRYLIELGQAMEPLAEDERNDKTRVQGCVSQVWLVLGEDGGRISLRGDSDAHIVKGLVALLTRLYGERTPQEALSIDPRAVLSQIGLSEHLSPQRSNGLASMVARIRRAGSPDRAGQDRARSLRSIPSSRKQILTRSRSSPGPAAASASITRSLAARRNAGASSGSPRPRHPRPPGTRVQSLTAGPDKVER